MAENLSNIVKQVREIVKNEDKGNDWKFHIVPVIKYAKKLAKIKRTNSNLVELAALLHDIGRFRHGDKNHHLTGLPEAEKILRKYNLSPKIIQEIKYCIKSHRCEKGAQPKTIIAQIISNADALAHFDVLPLLFYVRAKKHTFEDVLKWVDKKIERDWNNKLTLPEAKKIALKKYQAIKLILKSNIKYIK